MKTSNSTFKQNFLITAPTEEKTPPNSSKNWTTTAKVGSFVAGAISLFAAGYLAATYFQTNALSSSNELLVDAIQQPVEEPIKQPIVETPSKPVILSLPVPVKKITVNDQTIPNNKVNDPSEVNETVSKEIIQVSETSILMNAFSYTSNLVYDVGVNLLTRNWRPEGPFSERMKICGAAIVLFLAKSPILPRSLHHLQRSLR